MNNMGQKHGKLGAMPVGKIRLVLPALVRPAADVPGTWVSHCLKTDMVAQGDSLVDAIDGLRDSIWCMIEDDMKDEKDPLQDFKPAPDDLWALWEQASSKGVPTAATSLSTLDTSKVRLAALILVFDLTYHAERTSPVPPPWMIFQMEREQDGRTSQH